MSTVMVVAPHPDDETLGCGGALLRHKAEGDQVHWLIMTAMHESQGYAVAKIEARNQEITSVAEQYQFDGVHRLNYPTTGLDTCPRSELVAEVAKVVTTVQPTIIYLPYRNDIHSDHKITFDVAAACTKPFRYPSIKSIRVYETLSETEQSLSPEGAAFQPNLFVDVSAYLEQKIDIMRLYKGEVGDAPFPRSCEVIEALARYRGSVIGVAAAEAYMLLREVI